MYPTEIKRKKLLINVIVLIKLQTLFNTCFNTYNLIDFQRLYNKKKKYIKK
jgi:hypothetical protein